LNNVFNKLSKHGLKLRQSKCNFFQKEVSYLGHSLSEKGIGVDNEKIDQVQNWPPPNNLKELKSFLGFAGFYRRFIKNFAKIADPLNKLCTNYDKGNKKLNVKVKLSEVWSKECSEAFDKFKYILCNKPVMAFVDFSKPFFLEIDASKQGLGAVLSQENDDNIRKPIAYASRCLRKEERNDEKFSSKAIEFLALKWAMTEKFKEYLHHNKVFIITDNNPLSYLKTTKSLSPKEVKWVAQIDKFDYEIKYRSGKNNTAADALSRKRNNYSSEYAGSDSDVMCLNTVINFPSYNINEMRTVQENDDVISSFKYLYDNSYSIKSKKYEDSCKYSKQMLRDKHHFEFKDGVLYKRVDEETNVIVLPKELQFNVLKQCHDHAGHQGFDKTLQLIGGKFFWSYMHSDIKKYVTNCDRCVRAKLPHNTKIPLGNIRANKPREIIAIDFTILERAQGIENVLVITDVFSKFVKCVPTKDQKATTVAKVLIREWFCNFGIPDRIHSDQGANFTSKLIKQICKYYSIRKSQTTPYHPQGNPQCERFNRTLHNLLRVLEDRDKKKWPEYICQQVYWYNVTVCKSTGYSPYYLFFGDHPKLPVDEFIPNDSSSDEEDIEDYVRNHDRIVRNDRACAVESNNKRLICAKKYYDKKAKESKLMVGQKVYKRIFPAGRNKIADAYGRDIYYIRECLNNNVYVISKIESTDFKTVNRSLIRPVPDNISDDGYEIVMSDIISDERNQDEIESDKSTSTTESINNVQFYRLCPQGDTAEVLENDTEIHVRRSGRSNLGKRPDYYST
jgi:transposase InsO family protein